MDINQVVNVGAGFILGILTKWLQEAHKRDKQREKNKSGKTK